MKHANRLAPAIAVLMLLVSYSIAHADITVSGNIDPTTDPNTWTSSTTIYVGKTSAGSLTVDGGSVLVSYRTYVGYDGTSSGVVTVDGPGSTWTDSLDLFLGVSGNATLKITNGGFVSVAHDTTVSDSLGWIDFGSTGGTLTTRSLIAPLNRLLGTGLIVAKGIQSDFDVTFDANPIYSNSFGSAGTLTLDLSATSGNGDLYFGYRNNNAMTVKNGAKIYSNNGYLGGLSGTATVDGPGSSWTTSSSLYVGYGNGSGTLNIMNGGAVSASEITYVTPSRGSIVFSSGGGTLTTQSLYAAAASLTGTGVITTRGLVADYDLTFDGIATWSTTFGTAGTLSLDMSPAFGNGDLGVGYGGNSKLLIKNNADVYCLTGQLGVTGGSSGSATVDGTGSTWTSSSTLYVGYGGSGSLLVANGGTVKNGESNIAYLDNSSGAVVVDGSGSTWFLHNTLEVGYHGTATLDILHAGAVTCNNAQLASRPNSSATVNIDGPGSKWTSNGVLAVGNPLYSSGSATVNISNGGVVSVSGPTTVTPTLCSINFGPNGGTLTTNTLKAPYAGLTGTRVIATKGLIGGLDLTFDGTALSTATFGAAGTLTLDLTDPMKNGDLGVGYGRNSTLTIKKGAAISTPNGYLGYNSGFLGQANVNGAGSQWMNSQDIYVGYSGNGALNVLNGGNVSNVKGYIGYNAGSSGTVTVEGPGSTWTNADFLYVGNSGSGMMSIANGGTVTNTRGFIGEKSATSGLVAVDGTGSTWTNNISLLIGMLGSGTLSISGGGSVTAPFVGINNSLVSVDVGRGSLFKIGNGNGSINNAGTVRFLAGAGVPYDNTVKYSPIAAGTWGGTTGTYQAVGGTWDATNHQFTASAVTSGTSSFAVSIDLASIQRILVNDNAPGATNWSVGASFPATTTATNITFTATAISGTTLDALENQLASNEYVVSGWTLSTTNYTTSSTTPVYLSFNVGALSNSDDLQLWHYDGSTWTKFDAFDLTYDGAYASFTATSFSAYAVTVPEPATLVLLLSAALSLSLFARRKQK